MKGVAVLCLALALANAAPSLWPAPKTMTCGAGSETIASRFKIYSSVSSAPLTDAIKRYTALIPTANSTTGVMFANISVASADPSVTSSTDYSYTINHASGTDTILISAQTVFGAMGALETLSQLVSAAGVLQCLGVSVTDAPNFPYRGVLVDSARRFVPVETLMNIIDGMAYTKMNALRLHVADYMRVRVIPDGFGMLNKSAEGGWYTEDDVAKVVAYANARGVRVIPSVELPGHASGLAPLGVSFCDAAMTRLKHDVITVLNVGNYLSALAKAFAPETTLSLGGDLNMSLTANGSCTVTDTMNLLAALQQHLANDNINVAVTSQAGLPLLANAGHFAARSLVAAVTNASLPVVMDGPNAPGVQDPRDATLVLSNGNFSRCGHATPNSTYALYFDPAAGLSAAQALLVYGASANMWSGGYCDKTENGQWEAAQAPCAFWMSNRGNDQYFAASITGAIFPPAVALAGSLWNYQASANWKQNIADHVQRLQARGILACGSWCTPAAGSLPACNEKFMCSGKEWSTHSLAKEPTMGTGMLLAIVLLSCFSLFVGAVMFGFNGKASGPERSPLLGLQE